MRDSYYQFNEQDAYDFARHVGIDTKKKGNNLHFITCPYCKSRKDKGTFAIDLKTGKFKCLRASCGISGNMITLSKDFDFSLGTDVDAYYRIKKTRYKKLPQPKEKIIPKEPAIAYLETRGISKEIADRYEITTQTDHDNVLVFPFFDCKGILQFVKYRKTDFNKEKDKCKEWCESNSKPILFGMKQCEENHKNEEPYETLTISEGQIDCLAIAEAFKCEIDVVSVPTGALGMTFFPHCWDWLSKYKNIVIFGDYEKGSITLLDDFKKRLKCTIKHVRFDDYKDCKDANELLLKYGAEHVKACVENAQIVPMPKIIKLSDVKSKNIYELPKVKTGIKQLDRMLCGGIPFGMVTLLTGKRGGGKSTVGSQIISSAIGQNYPSFVYSGELPNYLFKTWIDFQIAGRRNIVENTNDFGETNRFITNSTQEQINSWYDDMLFLYDNSNIEEDEDTELTVLLENAILQYGVKVILLDNLMTAMYLETDNAEKFERQGKLVRKLSILAMKYDVVIILVAHKRKTSFVSDENDEVSGSSDITNLAGITISYDRPLDNEVNKGFCTADDRVMKLTKNRLFGKVDFNGFYLHYDEKSKRVYGNGDDIDFQYNWQVDFEYDGMEETPFG